MRKAEVRLAEHGELRKAVRLHKAPDHTTLYRFLRRLDEQTLVVALNETVRSLLLRTPLGQGTASGNGGGGYNRAGSPSAISTFYVQCTHNRGGRPRPWRK